MHRAAREAVVVVEMCARAVVDDVLLDVVVAALELRVEGGLLLVDAQLAAEVVVDAVVARLVAVRAVAAIARRHHAVRAGAGRRVPPQRHGRGADPRELVVGDGRVARVRR